MKTLLTYCIIALAIWAGFIEIKKRPELAHHFYGLSQGHR